ncbi:MAG: DUF4399 domain-containing protein [Actinomycetota bacterium]
MKIKRTPVDVFAVVSVAVAALLALSACGTAKTKSTRPTSTITLNSPAAGSSVQGNVVSLDVTAKDVQIVKADGDTSGKTGHWHVFIDRDPVAAGATIPKEAGIVHAAASPIKLTGLSIGSHKFTVVLGDGTHARIGTDAASVTVEVKGPSVDASAPATLKAGLPLTVSVKVEGVTLVKADGNTSGTSGHLHVFIDRDPTAAGTAIPKEAGIIHSAATTIPVPGLAAGEHTIWVVLGDGTHVPFDPPVQDKLTVTVA